MEQQFKKLCSMKKQRPRHIIWVMVQLHWSMWGHFNLAFEYVLNKLNQNLEADITICVVSDGHEPSNMKDLKQQIDSAKQKYQIQFTSIAVGSDYPFELFQTFRDYFHNGALSQGIHNLKGQLQKKQIKAFEIVKSQLTQSKKIEFEQLVWESINAEPSFFALEDAVVASMADKLTTKYGKQVNETKQAPDVAEFIQTSCQEFLKTQSNQKFKDSKEQAKEIKQVAQCFYERVDQITEKKMIKLEVSSTKQKKILQYYKKSVQESQTLKIQVVQIKLSYYQNSILKQSIYKFWKTQEGPRLVQLEDEQNYENLQQQLILLINQVSDASNHLINLEENQEIKNSIEQAREMEQLAKDLFKKADQSSWNKQSVDKFLQKLEKDLIILKIISQGKLNPQDLYGEKFLSLDCQTKRPETQTSKSIKLTDQPELQNTKKKLTSLLMQMADVPRYLMILQTMSNEKFKDQKKKSEEMIQIIQNLFIRGEQSTFNEEIINKFIKQLEQDAQILENLGTVSIKDVKDEARTKNLYEFVPKLLFYVAYLINYSICLILEQYHLRQN